MARAAAEGLGERIRSLRAQVGITARELDALADLAACHVNAIELTSKISTKSLERIADVFGVSLDWLLRGDGRARTRDQVRAAVARASSRAKRVAEQARS